MSTELLALLCGASYLTAILSAVVGLAGGMTLLVVMLMFFDPLVVLPLHGVIQLTSNGSRCWFQRQHIETWVLKEYVKLIVPMAIIGLFVGREVPTEAIKVAIGIFVLVATWRPTWLLLGLDPGSINPKRRFLALGGIIGFLNMTVGATGPFAAPFFLRLGLSRYQLVGTKAATQMMGHLVKVIMFWIAGFAFMDYAYELLLLSICVVAGSYTGSQILSRVSEKTFEHLYQFVLTCLGVRLVIESMQNIFDE